MPVNRFSKPKATGFEDFSRLFGMLRRDLAAARKAWLGFEMVTNPPGRTGDLSVAQSFIESIA